MAGASSSRRSDVVVLAALFPRGERGSSRSCALRQSSAACALVWSCANAAAGGERGETTPPPPPARRARRHNDRDETRVVELFGCEARDGCPLALEEEEDEASASSPSRRTPPGGRARGGARAQRRSRARPPGARLPLGTLERRAPWPSRADESLDASVSFADRFSDPRRTRARASVRRRDDRGRGREWTGAGAWTGEMPRRNAFVSTKRVSSPCHVSTCVTSPAPDSKIKPSTAVFASVCLSESASASGTSARCSANSKKKKMGSTFHRGSDFRPLDKLSRYAAIESSRRAFGTHSRASGARCLRAKTVA